jgi:hypothetical protein
VNIGELIERLKQHPADMRVVVSGYERGVADVGTIEPTPIQLNRNDAWYFGRHEECEEAEKHETALHIVGAVV